MAYDEGLATRLRDLIGGCAEDDDLRRWVARGVAYARGLPPK